MLVPCSGNSTVCEHCAFSVKPRNGFPPEIEDQILLYKAKITIIGEKYSEIPHMKLAIKDTHHRLSLKEKFHRIL